MRNAFCGWYFKCQSPEHTLAVIPAFHSGGGSIQLITDTGAWHAGFPASRLSRKGHLISLGENCFDTSGFTLRLDTPEISAFGAVHFGDLLPLRYDIMGPFRYVPFMECRHSVLSMYHRVTGEVRINGECYRLQNGQGFLRV